jgi:hypothetical protein
LIDAASHVAVEESVYADLSLAADTSIKTTSLQTIHTDKEIKESGHKGTLSALNLSIDTSRHSEQIQQEKVVEEEREEDNVKILSLKVCLDCALQQGEIVQFVR